MLRITALASVLVLGACGGGQTCPDRPSSAQAAPAVAPDDGSGRIHSDCPMNHPGVEIAVTDVQEGAMLTITARRDHRDDVREIGRRIENLHARRMAETGGERADMGHESMMLPASTAVAEEINDGIRLVFIPKNPADLQNLRSRAREHAELMRTGACPRPNQAPTADRRPAA